MAINPKNNVDKCFHYAATVPLNYGEIKWNLDRILNTGAFKNIHKSDGIKYPS